MSLYFFRISTGRYSGAADQAYEFEDRVAAWTEMTKVCADLLGGIARSRTPSGAWSCSTRARSRCFESAWLEKPPDAKRPSSDLKLQFTTMTRSFLFTFNHLAQKDSISARHLVNQKIGL
jgi:hypothetical protein